MKKLLFIITVLNIFIVNNCLAQWVQCDGIYGGRITTLAANGNNIVAGSYSNLIYLSSNNGTNWTSIFLNNKMIALTFSIALNGNNIYVGTDAGFYISTNSGNNWMLTALNKSARSLAIIGNTIFAGTSNYGVYISTDNGNTWTQTSLNNKSVLSLAISGNIIYAGTGNYGVFISTDNGNTWTQTSLNNKHVLSLAVSGNTIFAGTSGYGVYISTDNGNTWAQTSLNNIYVRCLAVNVSTVFAGDDNCVYVSYDNGNTWAQSSLNNKIIKSLIVNENCIFAGTDIYGVYKSANNGNTWTQSAINGEEVFSLAANINTIFAGTYHFGLFRSLDNGNTWTQTPLNDQYIVNSILVNGSNIFAGTWYYGVYLSTNNGTSWIQTSLNNKTVYSLTIKGNTIFAGTRDYGVYYSTDNGNTWIQTLLNNKIVKALTVSGNNIFAGTETYGVYLSTNNGDIWSQTSLNDKSILSLAVNGNNIFAGTEGWGVYMYTNYGGTWMQTSLINKFVSSLVVSGDYIFAGVPSSPVMEVDGVYYSTNSGTNWIYAGLNIAYVYSLAVNLNYVFAGTKYSSIWKRPLSDFNIQLPDPPVLIKPAYDSVMSDLTPDLVWTASGATAFWGQVSTDSLFSTLTAENQNIQAFNWTPTLTQYTTYYWRVKAKNTSGVWSDWSSVWRFTLSNAPTLIFPTANSTISSPQINFQWSDCSAMRYELWVDNNSGFGSPEVSKYNINELRNYTGVLYQIDANWLAENVYYWKIIAYYSNGSSAASSTGVFTYSPTKLSTPSWVPVYRAYKSSVTDHFYCTSLEHLITAVENGYDFEKVDGYLSLSPFETVAGLANIFRIYVSKHGSHYYTSNSTTKDSLISSDTTNIYEGITGYGYASSTLLTDVVKFYYLFKSESTPVLNDHFYTISDIERSNALQRGYSDRGFIAYVSPNGEQITEPWMEAQPEIGYGINPQNGNVGSFNKTSFNIPGARTSLSFMHIYNSYTTRLMNQVNSIGAGWSHSYMANLIENNGKYYVTWPGGGIHIYNVYDLKPVTKGVYDELTKVSSTRYQIKKKDQFIFTFDVLYPSVDPTALLVSIKDRNNNTISLNYNSQRKLITVVSPEGRSLTFTYYEETGKTNLIKEVTDPSGRKVKFEYDNDLNLVKFTDAKNQITTYAYDTTARYDHLLKKITLPKGNTIENSFNGKKIITQRIGTGSNLNLSYNTNYAQITDGNMKVTELYYSTNGMINRILKSSVNSYFEYNDALNPVKPTKITDGKGFITTISYDSKGNPLQINKPENTIHQFAYNSFNDITQYTDPRNKITFYVYNGTGNLTSIQTPRGSTNITYNSNGTINTITDPLSRITTLGYNSYGNVTSVKNNLNLTTYYTYDNLSRLITTTDANGRMTSYVYDNNDLPTTISKSGSANINYNYDANDNLISITNPNSKITSLIYNNKDLLQSVSNPLSQQTGYTYFENSMLQTKSKPDGQSINYAYDNSNRLIGMSGAVSGTITYDNNDNILSISDNNGAITYTYDGLNRLTSYTDYYNNTVSYGYDQADNIISITYPGNKVVNYAYYDDNLLQSVTDWNGKVTTYFYRNDGSLLYIQYPNLTKKTFSYDGAGRVIGISNTKSDNSIINNYNFTFDNVGNHLSVSQTEQFSNPVLNPSTKQYTYNNADRITSDGANSYSFDANGNLLQKTGSVTSNYEYDGENRLTNISGEYSAGFKYDLFGYRRYSNINGNIKKYILDINSSLPKVLMETDNNGNVLNYYVYGLELISRIKPDNSTVYYHSDFRGSIIAMTDANQNITHKYSYDSFGNILQSNETDANPFKYVGAYGVMEEGYGLYFMRARYYDSKIGRFISEDPVWDLNLYLYADNNPEMNIDPNGRKIMKFLGVLMKIKKIIPYIGKKFDEIAAVNLLFDVGSFSNFSLGFSMGFNIDPRAKKVRNDFFRDLKDPSARQIEGDPQNAKEYEDLLK